MDFLDLRSLLDAAEVYKFRNPLEGENTEEYRIALSDYVRPMDFKTSEEIRRGKGWHGLSFWDKLSAWARRF